MNTRSSFCNLRPSGAWLCLAALGLGLSAPHGRAAPPREQLLRLVPEDVAFCLVVQDLRDHSKRLSESPFARALQKSAFAALLRSSAEFQKLADADAALQKHLDLDWTTVRDELLGEAVVLAYRPPPPGKADQEQGLLLLRARDPRRLADFVERLNRVQKESGDLKELETRQYLGLSYQRRVERKAENYYYLDGPVLAFTSQETILHEALARARRASEDGSPVGRQMQQLGVDRALAAVWINPRAFDAEMERNAARAGGVEAAGQRAFLRYWKAMDGAALALTLDEEVRLTLALRARAHEFPQPARRFLERAASASTLWNRFPDDALLAAATRTEMTPLLEMLGEFLPRESRDALVDALERSIGAPAGRDFVRELLPALGPDWGICLTAPRGADKSWLPDSLAALRVRPDEGADQALAAAVHFYAQLLVLAHNRSGKEPMSLRTVRDGKVEVKYLASAKALPAGARPAFALVDGYLVFASSPEVIQRFVRGSPAQRTGREGEVPLLRLSVRELRQYVRERREALTALVAEKNNLSRDAAARRLDGLLAVIELIDRIELSQRNEPGRLALILRVQTSAPLK
jgi:hypothetical protein